MEGGYQDSEDDASNQNSPVDDADLEEVAAEALQKFVLPKPRLSNESVMAAAKSVGIDLPEHLAEFLADRAMKELRYAVLLSTQFSRHERARGLRASDFTKATKLMNCFNPGGDDKEEQPEESTSTASPPQIFLHRYSPEIPEDEEGVTNESQGGGEGNEEDGWQDYGSNATNSSGNKESPAADSSSGAGSANPEQQDDEGEGDENEQEETDHDNMDEMEFDPKMLPENIENEIEFMEEELEGEDAEGLEDFVIHQVILSS